MNNTDEIELNEKREALERIPYLSNWSNGRIMIHEYFLRWVLEEQSVKEISDEMGITVEGARQRLLKHGRRLRHPDIIKTLHEFYDGQNPSCL